MARDPEHCTFQLLVHGTKEAKDKMKFILSPCAQMHTPKMQISINGLVITINGQDYDLSAIPEGGQAEASEDSPFLGVITRDQVTIRYIYDMELAEDHQSHNWDDYTFEVEEGGVPCPIKWKSKEFEV